MFLFVGLFLGLLGIGFDLFLFHIDAGWDILFGSLFFDGQFADLLCDLVLIKYL